MGLTLYNLMIQELKDVATGLLVTGAFSALVLPYISGHLDRWALALWHELTRKNDRTEPMED
jgi:hypothetical protein